MVIDGKLLKDVDIAWIEFEARSKFLANLPSDFAGVDVAISSKTNESFGKS